MGFNVRVGVRIRFKFSVWDGVNDGVSARVRVRVRVGVSVTTRVKIRVTGSFTNIAAVKVARVTVRVKAQYRLARFI